MAFQQMKTTIFAFPRRARLTALTLCLMTTSGLTGQVASGSSKPDIGTDSLVSMRHLIERGHAAEALEQLEKLSAANPVPPGVDRLRGVALYTQDKLLPAEQAFAKALTADPADVEAMQFRGITLFRLGRPAAAIPLLESARGLAGPRQANGPVDPAYVLALCYLDTRRYDDARGAFALQFGFPADSASAYLLAARMLLRREYLPVAQTFARKALELSPSLPQAHLLLGETELAGNHLAEAVQQFEKERDIDPLEPSIYDRLGDAYTREGDYPRARQALQEAILLAPHATGPFILLGKVLLKEGDAEAAATYLERARGMDEKNYMTHSLLGQAYRQMGRVDDARRETDQAQKLQGATEPRLVDAK